MPLPSWPIGIRYAHMRCRSSKNLTSMQQRAVLYRYRRWVCWRIQQLKTSMRFIESLAMMTRSSPAVLGQLLLLRQRICSCARSVTVNAEEKALFHFPSPPVSFCYHGYFICIRRCAPSLVLLLIIRPQTETGRC